MDKKISYLKLCSIVCVVCILSLGAIWPLLTPGYFPMHDDTQVARVWAMGNALREGQFPVRLVAELGYGYGYPIFNFYGPLPYYVGGILAAAGLSALTATKVMFVSGIMLMALGVFALVSTSMGIAAGYLAAVLAVYAPYHAVQIYVRGAVGEFWASAWIPLVLLGIVRLTNAPTRNQGVIIGSVALAATITSHTISGYMTVVFLIGMGCMYWIFGIWNKRLDNSVLWSGLGMLMMSLGISSFFWLPALAEMRFTSVAGQIGAGADYHQHFVCARQLWESAWGYGGSAPGCIDGMSLKLGKLHIVLALAGLFAWRQWGKLQWRSLIGCALVLLLWSLIFTSSISVRLWEQIAGYGYIQYPWRFLSGASLALSVISAPVVMVFRARLRWVTLLILLLGVIAVNSKWFRPQYQYWRDPSELVSAREVRFRASRVSDEYLPTQLIRPQRAEDVVFDTITAGTGIKVARMYDTATSLQYGVSATQESEVTVNRAYFPGWKFWVNNMPAQPRISSGLPKLTVPAGESVIEGRFTDTPVRTIANMISVVSAICLAFYYVKTKQTHT